MPTQLNQIMTKEVSLVDRGANRKRFALRKNEDGMQDEILKACLDTPLENEGEVDAVLEKAGVSKKGTAAIKGALRILQAYSDELTDSHKSAMQKLFGKPAAGDDDSDGDDDDMPSKKSKTKKNDETQETSVAVNKSEMSPELRAHFERIEKANVEAVAKAVELEKALTVERDLREQKECIEKADREFPMVGPAKEVGALILKLKKAGLYDEAEKVLRSANEKAKASALFEEKGSSKGWGAEGDSAGSRLHKAAVQISEAKGISFAKAYTEALESNKDLYTEFNAEKEGK